MNTFCDWEYLTLGVSHWKKLYYTRHKNEDKINKILSAHCLFYKIGITGEVLEQVISSFKNLILITGFPTQIPQSEDITSWMKYPILSRQFKILWSF